MPFAGDAMLVLVLIASVIAVDAAAAAFFPTVVGGSGNARQRSHRRDGGGRGRRRPPPRSLGTFGSDVDPFVASLNESELGRRGMVVRDDDISSWSKYLGGRGGRVGRGGRGGGGRRRGRARYAGQGGRRRRRRFPRANRATLDFNEELKTHIRGRRSGVRSAHSLLLGTLSEIESGRETEIVVNTISMTTVINGWARSNERDAGDRALELLVKAAELYAGGDVGSKPNARTFSGAIRAVIRSGRGTVEATLQAEALLRALDRLYSEDGGEEDDLMPDAIVFTTVMNAWADIRKGKIKGGGGGPLPAERAESLLRRMDRLYQRGVADTKPDTVAYCTVIKAWAASPSSLISPLPTASKDDEVMTESDDDDAHLVDPAERAESLLRELEARYAETSDSDFKPDAVAYTSVIRAWTLLARDVTAAGNRAPTDAAERAESLLLNMEDRYHETGDVDVKPDAILYGSVIDAWAESRAPGCAERAANILRKMTHGYEAGDEDVKPDAVAYTTLIKALASDAAAKKGREGAVASAERAERVLRGMESRSAGPGGDLDLLPDGVAYRTVMEAWAGCGGECAGERAEAVLNGMLEQASISIEGGASAPRPDGSHYTAVLKAWATAPSDGDTAAAKAEKLLDEIMKRYEEGDTLCKPSKETFQWALEAVKKGSDPAAGDRVGVMRQAVASGKERSGKY